MLLGIYPIIMRRVYACVVREKDYGVDDDDAHDDGAPPTTQDKAIYTLDRSLT